MFFILCLNLECFRPGRFRQSFVLSVSSFILKHFFYSCVFLSYKMVWALKNGLGAPPLASLSAILFSFILKCRGIEARNTLCQYQYIVLGLAALASKSLSALEQYVYQFYGIFLNSLVVFSFSQVS